MGNVHRGGTLVFVPGYAQLTEVFAVPENDQVVIDGQAVTMGMPCSDFQLNREYSLFVSGDDSMVRTVMFVQSGNVPTLYIDTASGDMDYIHMDKTHEENGVLRLYDAFGNLLNSETVKELKGRGNTSWWAEKKPYNITLSRQTDLLGMGSAQNWILLAEGSNVTPLRNKIVYDFADDFGMSYSPDCEWVDLYLNGVYAGLYLLSERNEIHPERIQIPQQGSFLISMEMQELLDDQNLPYVKLDSTQVLRIRYSSVSDQELTRIWTTLKNALLSPDGKDPVTGKNWYDLVDLDSWVRKYLIEEVFGNPDGGLSSQYFYRNGADPEGRIVAGPVWDYDFTMGGENYWLREYPNYLTMARAYSESGHDLPWFYEMCQKPVFYQKLIQVYEKEFVPLMTKLAEEKIDVYAAQIYPALITDSLRWGFEETDVQADLALMKSFLAKRRDFLLDYWTGDHTYHIVHVRPSQLYGGYFAIKDGECLPDLSDYESAKSMGWYHRDTGEPIDIRQPVHSDLDAYVAEREEALPLISHAPVALFIFVMLPVLLADILRRKKDRRLKNDPVKAK